MYETDRNVKYSTILGQQDIFKVVKLELLNF